MTFHGSAVWDKGKLRQIKDFSFNVNPLGTPDFVEELLKEAVDLKVHSYYPPNDYGYLESKLREYVGHGRVVVSNGLGEIISRLPPCSVPEPNYSSYRRANSYDAEFDGETWKYTLKGECVVTSNPVNPTGTCIDRGEARRFLGNGGLLVLDESFVELSDCESLVELVDDHPNLIVLRSFTKSLAVPGLRIGYAVFSKEYEFLKTLPEWRINSITYYVFSNLDYEDVRKYLDKSRLEVRSLRERMTRLFKGFESRAPYFIIELKADSALVNEEIVKDGFYLRDHRGFRNFKKEWARVAVKHGYEELYSTLTRKGFI
ncbi:MAG: aminotransferase class I/II-fold pyridoxal phosphate-dependent enzyme [Thermoprotei archaeon]